MRPFDGVIQSVDSVSSRCMWITIAYKDGRVEEIKDSRTHWADHEDGILTVKDIDGNVIYTREGVLTISRTVNPKHHTDGS